MSYFINPKTNKKIKSGGVVYQSLLKEGYNLQPYEKVNTSTNTKEVMSVSKLELAFQKLSLIEQKQKETLVIVKSSIQTKEWRQSQDWYDNGKKNECENYQKYLIKKIIGNNSINWKTHLRFNLEENEILYETTPNAKENGFEYTEDFDGHLKINNIDIYLNLKMVCEKGGAQTRTLREVYHFIDAQMRFVKEKSNPPFFVNIVDGNESHNNLNKLHFLYKKHKDTSISKKYIFIGDMYDFENWYKDLNSKFVFVNNMVRNIIDQIE